MLGVCACREEDEDAFTLLVCCTQYPAKTHRDVALWLCMHALTEKCYLMLEQEGTLLVGREEEDPQPAAACQELTESAEWWTTVNPISPRAGAAAPDPAANHPQAAAVRGPGGVRFPCAAGGAGAQPRVLRLCAPAD